MNRGSRVFAGSLLSLLALLALSCSASSGDPGGQNQGGANSSNGGGGATSLGAQPGLGGSGPSLAGTDGVGASAGTGGGGPACATDAAEATLTSEPVDIILVLDNSGSMHEEMGAAEANINVNFAGILDRSGVDYRVILLSRHRQGARTTGESEANTSICVAQPLSALPACPSEEPLFSERFYQYGEKIESFDALNWILDGYNLPEEENDLAPNGYKEWLRPGAKKVFVIMTDDDESNDTAPLTADAFLQGLVALSPEHFGSDPAAPSIVFHSIIGIKEKANATEAYLPTEPISTDMCTGNGAVIESPGPTYQELSRRTNGLRFPICQFPGYDAVFQAIAADVIVTSTLTCDFPLPATPAGKTLELDKIAVDHVLGNGTGNQRLQQVSDKANCAPDLFYIESERVWLCPQACDGIKADIGGTISVLFTCESQVRDPA